MNLLKKQHTLLRNYTILCYKASHNISYKRTFMVLSSQHHNTRTIIKSKTLVSSPTLPSFSKRFMFKNTSKLSVPLINKNIFHDFSRQHYAGRYRAINYDPNQKPVGGMCKKIPQHEIGHTQIQETDTGKVFAMFTTSPKSNDNRYHKISDEKVDGTMDVKGTGQYIGVMDYPKIISFLEIIKRRAEYQAYLDKHETKLDEIAASKKNAICEDRTSKDDSRFYNENGTKDDENFPFK